MKDAEIHVSDNSQYIGSGNIGTSQGNEVIRISTPTQFNDFIDSLELGNLGYYPSISGIKPSAHFSDLDFSEFDLFVTLFGYEGQDGGDLRQSKIRVRESDQTIRFDIKVRVPVGGSGMGNWLKLVFLTVPKDKANYNIEGTAKIMERNGWGVGNNYDINISD